MESTGKIFCQLFAAVCVCTFAALDNGWGSDQQPAADPPQSPASDHSKNPKPAVGVGKESEPAKPSTKAAAEGPEEKAYRQFVVKVISAVNRQFDQQARGAVEALLEARDDLDELRSAPRGNLPSEVRKTRLARAEKMFKDAEAFVKVLAKGDVNCATLDWVVGRYRTNGELFNVEKPLGAVNVEVSDVSELAQSVVTVRCAEETYRLVGWRVEKLQVGKRLAVSGVAFAHYSDEFKSSELVKATMFDKDADYVKARADRADAFKVFRKAIENTHRNATNSPVTR